MFREVFRYNWQFVLLSSVVALIPYGITCWPVAYLWLFLWFYSGEYKKFKFPKSIWFWAFSIFFVLHFIGYYYSNDKTDAYDIVLALPGFVVFPIVLSNYSLTKDEFKEILRIFCLSNVFLAAFLILRTLFYTVVLDYPIYTYSLFAFFIHPSYCSLYMIFSISVMFLAGFQLSELPRKDFFMKIGASALLMIAVLFCSPKIGLLTLALTIIFLGIYFAVKFKKVYYTLLFFLILSVAGFVFVKIVPFPLQRVNNFLTDYKTTKGLKYHNLEDLNMQAFAKGIDERESALARVFIWGSAWPVIKEHLLFGVGPGDVSSAMFTVAEDKGIYGFKKYNMHNQYIETQMGLGLIGTIVLLFLTIAPLIYAFLKKSLLLGVFSTLIILNFCVESMLRMSYFSFFFPLFLYLFILLYTNKNKPAENKE